MEDINKAAIRKRTIAEIEKLKEKVSREKCNIIKSKANSFDPVRGRRSSYRIEIVGLKPTQLHVAQDSAYWELKEKMQTLELNHERLQGNMTEVQMQHEAVSAQLQDELRRRPETLNSVASVREMCGALQEHMGRLRDGLQRCAADRATLAAGYAAAERDIAAAKAAASERLREACASTAAREAALQRADKTITEFKELACRQSDEMSARLEASIKREAAAGAALREAEQRAARAAQDAQTAQQERLSIERRAEDLFGELQKIRAAYDNLIVTNGSVVAQNNDIKKHLEEKDRYAKEMERTAQKTSQELEKCQQKLNDLRAEYKRASETSIRDLEADRQRLAKMETLAEHERARVLEAIASAERERNRADQAEIVAERERKLAAEAKEIAERETIRANKAETVAELERNRAAEAEVVAERERQRAAEIEAQAEKDRQLIMDHARKIDARAERDCQIVVEAKAAAEGERLRAEEALAVAERERRRADEAQAEAEREKRRAAEAAATAERESRRAAEATETADEQRRRAAEAAEAADRERRRAADVEAKAEADAERERRRATEAEAAGERERQRAAEAEAIAERNRHRAAEAEAAAERETKRAVEAEAAVDREKQRAAAAHAGATRALQEHENTIAQLKHDVAMKTTALKELGTVLLSKESNLAEQMRLIQELRSDKEHLQEKIRSFQEKLEDAQNSLRNPPIIVHDENACPSPPQKQGKKEAIRPSDSALKTKREDDYYSFIRHDMDSLDDGSLSPSPKPVRKFFKSKRSTTKKSKKDF